MGKFIKFIIIVTPFGGILFIMNAIQVSPPEFLNENFAEYGVTLIAVVLLFIVITIYNFFDLWNSTFRLSIEEKKKKPTDSFDDKQKEILNQVLAEENEATKKKLEQQASTLRQEYESLMSENLRRRDGTFVEDWRESLLVARKRLFDEGQNLLEGNFRTRRMGVLMAFAGILVPVFYIFVGEEVKTNISFGEFVASYWPFFTIVFITEIVAIFYLRLYTQTLGRIERNKNEITNIELRLTAGLMLPSALGLPDFEFLSNQLAKEERNFVIGKNESSAGIGIDRVTEILSKVIKGGAS